ncbi:hypothetical protein D9M69_225820 [compost metagenome]
MGRQALFAHGGGEDQHFQFDVEGAIGLVRVVQQVGQGLRIAFRACRLGGTEGLKGLGGDHPGRYRGAEVLRQEGAERLVFPGLHVAGGPVVEQAVAGDVLLGVGDGDGLAHLVALADPDAQFQLVVQALAGAEARGFLARRQGLAQRAAHRGAGDADGGGTAVVADGHVLVVGQQGIVRAEQAADVVGVVDAHIEVGVVADMRRQVQLAGGRGRQQGLAHGFQAFLGGAAFGQQVLQLGAQGAAGGGAQGEEGVQAVAAGGLGGFARFTAEQAGIAGRLQVEDGVADGHAAARRGAGRAEDAQRQVLQGEIGVAVGGGDPAAAVVYLGHVRSCPCRMSWPCRPSKHRSRSAAAGTPARTGWGAAPGWSRT